LDGLAIFSAQRKTCLKLGRASVRGSEPKWGLLW